MTTTDQHDAYASPRVAADLIGIPTMRVLALLTSKAIRPVTIRGRRLVSLLEVERAIDEGRNDGHSS